MIGLWWADRYEWFRAITYWMECAERGCDECAVACRDCFRRLGYRGEP